MRTLGAKLTFEFGITVALALLFRKLLEVGINVARVRLGMHLKARLRWQHQLDVAGPVGDFHVFAWRLPEADLDVALAVLDVYATADILQHDVVFRSCQGEVARRVSDFQPPRACLQPAGQLADGQVGSPGDEPRAFGHFLDADGAKELALERRVALHIGDFDLAAAARELNVPLRADNVDIAALHLGTYIACRVPDFDIAALRLGDHAAGYSSDLQTTTRGLRDNVRLLRHVDFQIHSHLTALVLGAYLIAAVCLRDCHVHLPRAILRIPLVRAAQRLLDQRTNLRRVLRPDTDVAALSANGDARAGRNRPRGQLLAERVRLLPRRPPEVAWVVVADHADPLGGAGQAHHQKH